MLSYARVNSLNECTRCADFDYLRNPMCLTLTLDRVFRLARVNGIRGNRVNLI